MNTETLRKLFVHRQDVFARQTADGKYFPDHKLLTDDILKDHLDGKHTIGVYQLDEHDTVKFSCIDIDISKKIWNTKGYKFEDWKDKIYKQINVIKNKLSAHGVTGYAEISGFKGAHVLYFFSTPVSAGIVRDINTILFDEIQAVDPDITLEYFPKQATLGEGGLGNLVKLPCGVHNKSKEFSYFIDDVTLGVNLVDQTMIEKIITPIDAMFLNCSVMGSIKKQAPLGQLNNQQRLILGYILLNSSPNGEKELRRLLEMQNDYDESTTNYHIGKIRKKDYKPITCKKLQTAGEKFICPGPCSNIKNGSSPIVFYHRHKGGISGAHTGQTFDSLDYKSKIDIYEKQGTVYLYKPSVKDGYYQLANFIVDITDKIVRDNGIEQKVILNGQLVKGDETYSFEMPSKDYGHVEKLKAEVYNVAGNEGVFCENWNHLQNAINKFTKANTTYIKEIFGYTSDNGDENSMYISPSVIVDADGPRQNQEIIVDLSKSERGQFLDLSLLEDEKEYKKLTKHINDDLLNLTSFGIMHSLLGHTFAPIMEPWLYKFDRTRYILFIRGDSGEGKSFIAQSMQHFYGPNFLDYESWKSTSNRIENAGFHFKDAVYLVDDWKIANITNYRGALSILQSYADRSSRGRLTKDAELKKSKAILGTLLVTGEDLPEGQSSVMARLIPLRYSQPKKNLTAGQNVLAERNKYSAVTARYIHHILTYPDKETVFHDFQVKTHEEFYKYLIGKHNDVRIARNMSLLYTSYYFFSEWFWPKKEAKSNQDKFKQYLIDQVDDLVKLTAIQRPAERFWYTLRDLIATGKLRLQSSNVVDIDKNVRGVPIIGFKGSGGEDYLILDTALREVEKYLRSAGESLEFSKITIIEDLAKGRYLKKDKPIKKLFNKQHIYVYPVESNNLTK